MTPKELKKGIRKYGKKKLEAHQEYIQGACAALTGEGNHNKEGGVGYFAEKRTDSPWAVDGEALFITAKKCDIRGWGYLTGMGHGALGLDYDDAVAIQRANADFITEMANKGPAIIRQLYDENVHLDAENARLREGLKEADGALEAAEQLNTWVASNISSACYESATKDVQVSETESWAELDDSMRRSRLTALLEVE